MASQDNGFSLSSWNYGSYAICNPSYNQATRQNNINYHQNLNNNCQCVPKQTLNQYNKYGKRPLREEERIVTNEYLQNINQMKTLEKNKNRIFRTKSANGTRISSQKNNQSKVSKTNSQIMKPDINNYLAQNYSIKPFGGSRY